MPLFCPACEASNPASALFCTECGEALQESTATPPSDGTAAPAPRPAHTRRRRRANGSAEHGDVIDRLHASQELGRARRLLARVRTLYAVLAVLSGLGAALLLIAGIGLQDTEEAGLIWLLLAAQAAMTAVLVVGWIKLTSHPFLWSIVLAALQTLNVATAIVLGEGIPWLGIVLMVGCWCAAGLLTDTAELMAKYPDLRATRRLRGEKFASTAPPGRIAQREAGRREAARRRKLRLAGGAAAGLLLVIAAVVLVLGGGGGPAQANERGIVAGFRQPDAPLDPVLEQFAAAWEARDLAAIGALYAERLARRSDATRLQRRFEKHAMSRFPELGTPEIDATGDDRKEARYETLDGPVTVVFEYEHDGWRMVALRF